MENKTKFYQGFADKVMVGFFEELRETSPNMDLAVSVMRKTVNVNMNQVWTEWQDAVNSRLPESTIALLINTQALDLAVKSVKTYRRFAR